MSSSRHSQQSSRCLSAGSYRAPKGVLGLTRDFKLIILVVLLVRKRRAPEGALRRTMNDELSLPVSQLVRKRRAPKGALRLDLLGGNHAVDGWAESNERQTVH